MARINLLPWRETLREERRKRFLAALAVVLVAAVGVILLGDQYLHGAIERQVARNRYVSQQNAVLDERIQQISDLKARRQQLEERAGIIQALQGNRPISGRIFDQLARTLPDGVHFTEVKMTGTTLSITGAAESNQRVSQLLRNLDASDWFDAPSLSEIKAPSAAALDQASAFLLTVHQARPLVTRGAE